MRASALAVPWAPDSGPMSIPGSFVLVLRLGEAPDDIPAYRDVAARAALPAGRFGIAAIDTLVTTFSDTVRVSRVHTASSAGLWPGGGHRGFDDLEQATGVARVFRVDVDDDCPIADLVGALHGVTSVQSASPLYVTSLPLSTLTPVAVSGDDGWAERDLVHASEALAYEPGDPAIVVAVVDTGIDRAHEAFADGLRAGLDTVRLASDRLSVGIELVGDESDVDDDPSDEVGHGTACAGIIGARAGRLPPGIAGRCGLLPMRALGAARMGRRPNLVGVGADVDIDAAIKYAADLGAKVISCSLGTPTDGIGPGEGMPHEEAVRYASARGCIVVAAGGNSGTVDDYVPACLDEVIAVGAVDRAGRPAAFSSRSKHIAVAAPGERVLSAALGGGYALNTGTSFAAPFVSGVVALMASRAARRARPLDTAMARRILATTARPWPEGTPDGNGSGVVDAVAALRALDREIDTEGPMDLT